eukprot:COSAG04_NODE_1_length_58448_cov_23.476478_28_plen_156_part_00
MKLEELPDLDAALVAAMEEHGLTEAEQQRLPPWRRRSTVAVAAAAAAPAPVEAPVARAESCFACGIVLLIAGGYAGSYFLFYLGVLGLFCAVPIFLGVLLPWCCHSCSDSCCPASERQRKRHGVASMVGLVLLLIAGMLAYATGKKDSFSRNLYG